jgi:hypothetical protein
MHGNTNSEEKWKRFIVETRFHSQAVRTSTLLCLGAFVGAVAVVAAEPVVVVKRATVVAFFEPASEQELQRNPDTNETLADFQEYVSRSKGPLEKAGLDFQVVISRSFQVRDGRKTRTFRLDKIPVGYYFVGPGRQPRVEQGVMTDVDLFAIVRDYFGIIVR